MQQLLQYQLSIYCSVQLLPVQCNSRLSQLFCQRAVLLSTELYTTMDCARLCCDGLRSRLSTVLRCTGLDCAVCTAVESVSTVLYTGTVLQLLHSSRSTVLYRQYTSDSIDYAVQLSIDCANSTLSTALD